MTKRTKDPITDTAVRLYAVYLKPGQRHPDALFYRQYQAVDWVNGQEPLPQDPHIRRVRATYVLLDMGGTSR